MSTETITATLIRESGKAYEVEYLGKRVWLPKSQIEKLQQNGPNTPAQITIPFWLYNKHWK